MSTDNVEHQGDAVDEEFTDPGVPAEHRPRRADVDPKAADRAERQVAAMFGLSVLGAIIAIAAYVMGDVGGDNIAGVQNTTMFMGLGIFLAMIGIGVGAIHWAKTLMRDHDMVEERHPLRSSEEARAGAIDNLKEGAKDAGVGVGRRGLLKGSLVTALAIAPLSVLVPAIGNLGGDWNVSKFRHTMWKQGVRLAKDPDGSLIKASDVTIGSVFHVIPDGLLELEHHQLEEKAKAVVLLIRMSPEDLKVQPGREDWSFDGIVAYSKICTHVGCPVALYEQQTHHLLCPCHQSTFDVADGAKVVFGPANRPLPQLPIAVDDEGYIIATDDFNEPIGPSYWERLK
ncbi:ubiquinol-cytochrome c reductase iron-sulfur subunit [Demequina sp. TTPB684]|uniref:cytochrome bc1 complex Rieske iron-sulfur subunit n=1 Tax=unclassified Demequina TaxID=2620311 RepID=UPI001CF39641|nr:MULTISPECIES: ubiquinol-cytochrome c reductase iron-sulfur subunit [unclassified Demequina]MCB2413837.1 ubiquinol-cytochrome c reductase iron-sulfur subunit [Demequina sp. TTPB684]UPU89149.1 ubiquinol-cytochrome c reductase iron-sulfur subunit [Demequina sp. TMPB413]